MELQLMSLEERRTRSALVILVPEVMPQIAAYRRAYTADGASVPAHITLLCPFLAPVETTAPVHERISDVVSASPRFEFVLSQVEQFPTGVMYLKVEPASPFRTLIADLKQGFPEASPYWDRFDVVIPHVTVADAQLAKTVDLADIAANVSSHLPVRCEAKQVVLIQRVRPAPAPWDIQGHFPLDGPEPSR